MYKKELEVIVVLVCLTVMVVPVNAWVISGNPPGEDNNYELCGPHTKGIVINVYQNTTAEWTAMNAGNLDLEDLPLTTTTWPLNTTWIDQWTNSSNFTVVNSPSNTMYILDINNNYTYCPNDTGPYYYNPTSDVHLRQAIAFCVDRSYIVSLSGGSVTPIYTPIPTYMSGYIDSDISPTGARADLTYGGYTGNLTAANLTLNDNGYDVWNTSSSFGYPVRTYVDPITGIRQNLNLTFYSRSDLRGPMGNSVNANLNAVGIGTTYVANLSRSNVTGPVFAQQYFNLYTGGWTNIGPDPDYLCNLYNGSYYIHSPPNTNINYDGINDPELNYYLTSIELAADRVAGGVACNISQIRFATMAAAVPLYCPSLYKAYKNVPVEAAMSSNSSAIGNWTHIVNQPGAGVNSWWSTLNMYQNGNLYPDNYTYYGFSSTVASLDIVYASSYWDMEVLGRIYDSGAIRDPMRIYEGATRDPMASWVPQLFNNWTIDTWIDPITGQAETRLNVTLRPDAYWQDGVPVNMTDVNYTLVEISQDLMAKGMAPASWYSQYIIAFNIIDPYNVEILLNTTVGGYWEGIWVAGWVLANPIIPEHVWKPIVDNSSPSNNLVGSFQPDPDIIGTGPFIWMAGNGMAAGTNITMVANKPGTFVDHTATGGRSYTSPGYYNYHPYASVIVDPSTLSVGPGYQCQGTVSIRVANVKDLYLWVFSIRWNPATLEYVSITEGNFLRSWNRTTGILVKSVNQAGGCLEQAVCSLLGNSAGVNGSGVLATITFRAKAPGTSVLEIYFQALLDSNLNSTPSTTMNGDTVEVVRIPGDINGDNQVTYKDVGILCRAYGSNQGSSNWSLSADLNYDGVVDYKDLFILSRNYSG